MFFLFFPSFLPPTLFLSFPFYAFFLFHSSLSFFPAFSPFTLSLFCLPSFQPHFLSSSFPILFQCLILLILLSCPPFIYFLYLFFKQRQKNSFLYFPIHHSFFVFQGIFFCLTLFLCIFFSSLHSLFYICLPFVLFLFYLPAPSLTPLISVFLCFPCFFPSYFILLSLSCAFPLFFPPLKGI